MNQSRIVLNRILQELTVSTNSFMQVDIMANIANWSEMSIRSFKVVHLNSIILALCKYLEFYKAYRNFIPQEYLDYHQNLNKKLCSLDIVGFRNKFIGHILDKKTKEPLSDKEANDFYYKLSDGNIDEFISNINGRGLQNTMIKNFELTRDAL